MKKLGIIFDSFAISHEDRIKDNKDIHFIPLVLSIDNKIYKAGKGAKQAEISKILNESDKVKTSLPAPKDTLDIFEKTSKEYENVIYFSISSALSGTYKAAAVMAREFKNVTVIESIMVGDQYLMVANKILKLSDEGKSFDEITKWVNDYFKTLKPTYVIPKTVDSFIRSGRLGKIIGELLLRVNAIPIISFEDNLKLHKKSLKRTWKRAVKYAVEKTIASVEGKKDYQFMICHTQEQELAKYAKDLFKEKGFDVIYTESSLIVEAVTGSGSISVGAYKNVG